MEPESATPMDVSIVKQEEMQEDQNEPTSEPIKPAKKSKPRKRPPKNLKPYQEAVLNDLVAIVQKGGMSITAASKQFGIPRGTMQYRLSNRYKNRGRTGPSTNFTAVNNVNGPGTTFTVDEKGDIVLDAGPTSEPTKLAKQSKPRKQQPNKPSQAKAYHETILNDLLDIVQKGGMSMNAASKQFGIPRGTMQYRLSNKYKNSGTTGSSKTFTADEERDVVSWLTSTKQRGFLTTHAVLRHKFATYLTENPRKGFKNNMPNAVFVLDAEPTSEPTEPSPQSKPRKRQPNNVKTYQEAMLNDTLEIVQKGGMTMYSAAKQFGIPRTTMQYRLSKKFKNKGGKGPCTVFTADEERDIGSWLMSMEQRGFPLTRAVLIHKFSKFLTDNPRKNPFKDNVPGKGFFRGFLRRHPQLTETIGTKSKLSCIQEWFQMVQIYLINHGLFTILEDPSRVLIEEECGFFLNPESKKVIPTSWTKYIPGTEANSTKQNMTVTLTFCADGNVVTPNVILPQPRLSKTAIESFPSSWVLRPSENGSMDSKNFLLYVTKVIHPYLVENGVQLPVLYFVEGHLTLTALKAADTCAKLGIFLIALYPDAARVLHPTDIGICQPLKDRWPQEVKTWKQQTKSPAVTLKNFGTLLKTAMDSAFTPSTIIDAFAASGLVPFNFGKTEHTELAVAQEPSAAEVINAKDPPKPEIAIPVDVIEKALEMLGPVKILRYKHEQPENLSHEDRVLAFIYHNILCRPSAPNAEEAETTLVKDEHSSDNESLQNDAPLSELMELESENRLENGVDDIAKQMENSSQPTETLWIKTESE